METLEQRKAVIRTLRAYNAVSQKHMSQNLREGLGKQFIPHHVQEKVLDVFMPMMGKVFIAIEESFAKFESGELNFEELVVLQLKLGTEGGAEAGETAGRIVTEWATKHNSGVAGGERMTLV